MQDEEIWKDVLGCETMFAVSNKGRLYGKRSGKVLSQTDAGGYLGHSTKIGGRDGQSVRLRTHRIVAEAFLDNPDCKPQVNHIDGNKHNNCASNLEWVTGSENMKHAHSIGLINVQGVQNPAASLTTKDLEYIKLNSRQSGGKMTQRQLGNVLNVSHVTVGRVLRDQTYAST